MQLIFYRTYTIKLKVVPSAQLADLEQELDDFMQQDDLQRKLDEPINQLADLEQELDDFMQQDDIEQKLDE